jgi:hypothetical protein
VEKNESARLPAPFTLRDDGAIGTPNSGSASRNPLTVEPIRKSALHLRILICGCLEFHLDPLRTAEQLIWACRNTKWRSNPNRHDRETSLTFPATSASMITVKSA